MSHEISDIKLELDIINIKLDIIMLALGVKPENKDPRPPAGGFEQIKKLLS